MNDKEIKILQARLERLESENATLQRKVDGLNTVIAWAQGYDDIPDTLFEPPENPKPYWWRTPLRELAERANNGTLII